eukprot:gnl/MRDRNA2_/MRDRNA2_75776_c0_seq3.p1 gnl/MRDRNA2_/MRDRNA2_75776_c0~~gnl/MRDRNA2_/MRDRNA2_75776_c0_seq3.p1  ORF type:complete len:409 (+),score=54.15 gnl/MRDRNA2_/MRDRNA2_75776_c0_seq3:136-1362(+)
MGLCHASTVSGHGVQDAQADFCGTSWDPKFCDSSRLTLNQLLIDDLKLQGVHDGLLRSLTESLERRRLMQVSSALSTIFNNVAAFAQASVVADVCAEVLHKATLDPSSQRETLNKLLLDDLQRQQVCDEPLKDLTEALNYGEFEKASYGASGLMRTFQYAVNGMLQLEVVTLRGESCRIKVQAYATLLDVKKAIADKMRIPVATQDVIYQGNVLTNDNQCLSDCCILPWDAILQVVRVQRLAVGVRPACHTSGVPSASIQLWDLGSGECVTTFEGFVSQNQYAVTAIDADWTGVVTPRRLLSGDDSGVIRVWDLDRGSCLLQFRSGGIDDSVLALAVDWRFNQALSGSADGFMKLWGRRYGTSTLACASGNLSELVKSAWRTELLWIGKESRRSVPYCFGVATENVGP